MNASNVGTKVPMEIQKERIISGGVIMTPKEFEAYCAAPDIVGESAMIGGLPPPGYKRCGRCRRLMKFHMFNQNKASANNTSGNCKECQKLTSKAAYDKHKGTINYKEYYAVNKEKKLAANKKSYEKNKETRAAAHKAYRTSAKGRRVMKKAHSKRKAAMSLNAAIPWTKDLIIARDRIDINTGTQLEHPLCVLCGKPVTVDKDLHMEHLIPIVLGGADCFTNVGCAHTLCNLRKSKDAKEIEVEQVEELLMRSQFYIETHPEQFPELYKSGQEED